MKDLSNFAFVHHQESTNSEETTTAKQTYKSHLRKNDKEVRQHDDDNGPQPVPRFKEQIDNKNKLFTSVDWEAIINMEKHKIISK